MKRFLAALAAVVLIAGAAVEASAAPSTRMVVPGPCDLIPNLPGCK